MKKTVLYILLSIVGGHFALAQTQYASPFKFPLLLSANFGELRPNHFHNGLDIKTQGVTGKPVYSIADGYISRVAVLHGGYGQAVYVSHPNGYTSVYGHVEKFAPRLQQRVRDYQYAHETFICNLHFSPEEFPVRQGDLIALSGNEGASAGPHLHLEIRETASQAYIDPMPYYSRMIKDSKPPVVSLIGIYPLPGEGLVEGKMARKLLDASSFHTPIAAWGKIYAGVSAKDYMDGTSNFYGVHSVRLFVDEKEVFSSLTDRVEPDENRMINGFTDFKELKRTRRLIMRSYRAPGNKLSLLHTDKDNGVVCIDEKRDYQFRYELEDNFGNRTVCRFVVRGVPAEIPVQEREEDEIPLYWNRTNIIQKPGMQLVIPKGVLYEDDCIQTRVVRDTAGVSYDYVLDAEDIPLHNYCDLSIGVRHYPVTDSTKYYVVQKRGRDGIPLGGKMENGWVKARVRALGTFAVAVDTIAPRLIPLNQTKWRTNPRSIRIKLDESGSGIADYKVYIDGKFVLFGMKKRTLVIQDTRTVAAGKRHHMEVVVTDLCGNVQQERYAF